MDREFSWGISLCEVINGLIIPGYEQYKVTCEYATEHRCGIMLTGTSLSSLITGTDPIKDGKQLL